MHPFFWARFKTQLSDLAGDEGGGWGKAVGRWPMEGGQGGRWGGGAPESSVGATKGALLPLFGLPSKPDNSSDLAGDEAVEMGGRRGEVAHGGRAKGGDGGGAPEEQALVFLFWAPLKPNNWSDLAGDEGGGMGGGVGRWPMEGGQGGRGGGGTREQCGSNKRCTGSLFLAP